eukprot:2850292-Rhodomonas_salina.2
MEAKRDRAGAVGQDAAARVPHGLVPPVPCRATVTGPGLGHRGQPESPAGAPHSSFLPFLRARALTCNV